MAVTLYQTRESVDTLVFIIMTDAVSVFRNVLTFMECQLDEQQQKDVFSFSSLLYLYTVCSPRIPDTCVIKYVVHKHAIHDVHPFSNVIFQLNSQCFRKYERFQQHLITVLAPCQDMSKPSWRCCHIT